MKKIRLFILMLSLCVATPAQADVTVVVEDYSLWNRPFWPTSSYRTYTVCNSCCHSRCSCYDYQVLSSTEGIIATFIISAIALAVRLLQENDCERVPRRQERTREVVHVRVH